MTLHPELLASTIGKIFQPLFDLFAWLLAAFYSLIPNYAVAIALLTIVVMIVVFPITRRGTRSMMRMQLLAPELKQIQNKYKAKAGMSTAERQELRQKLNEEMMALYKEHGVSPTGGCLPMFLQFPIFIILYDTIRGLTREVKIHVGGNIEHVIRPLYVSHTTKLYQSIVQHGDEAIHHGGKLLPAFGIDLADSVKSAGLTWPEKLPYIALILVAIALQYVQMKQLSGRNPAAASANPQMQQMQKIMPLIFAVIYIAIPAGVNVYFIVSSLFRIGQQEYMYRHDPQLRASLAALHERAKASPKPAPVGAGPGQGGASKGLFARLREVALQQAAPSDQRGASGGAPSGRGASPKPAVSPPKPQKDGGSAGATPSRSRGGAASGGAGKEKLGARAGSTNTVGASRPQSRAQGKRPRRPR